MKKTIFLILILFQTYLQSQTFNGNLGSQSLNWTAEQKDFNSPPRDGVTPMSIKLWNNYGGANSPSPYGSLLEINGFVNHLVSQLYFDNNWNGGRILYRSAFYGQNTWDNWRYILDSKSDVESSGNLKIQGNGNNYILNGNVGIGTENIGYQTKLHVKESGSSDNIWRGRIVASGDLNAIVIGEYGGKAWLGAHNSQLNAWSNLIIQGGGGNVGIGMMNPLNKLDVNGTIHSKEVKVDMLDWSDFVFKKEYELPTLAEVEKHIAEKGHLENIPSEEEVLKNGINLGEMNAKLLQKIEELTLYSIDQNKKIETQAKEIESLKDLVLRVTKIESELARK